MKTLYVAILVCLLLLEDVLSQRRKCKTSDDCSPNECCLTYNRPRGRRRRSADGYCSPLGDLGSKCIYQPYATPPSNLEYVCRCGIGLKCQSSGMREVPIGEIGTCVREFRLCDSDRDCGFFECCLMKNRPIGKRRKRSSSLGTCRPLGHQGDQCYVDHPQMCPRCRFGKFLQCVPTGMIDMPLGRIGTCEFGRP